MKDMRIAFFGVKSWERDIIEREITNLDTYGIGIFADEVQDNLGLAAKYDVISTFIYCKMDKKILDALPNLKMIATRSTGVDHIDMEECKKRNIVVKNVPEYGANTVAEYTMALMLAVAKKIVPAVASVEDGEFSPEGLTGMDLHGKILGVVGVGKIGQNVVKLAKAFGMKILVVEKERDEKLAKKLGFKNVDLETLLRQSDIVTLHVPVTAETRHLINKNNIKLMKPGSILINTSRGGVVEATAIIYALNKKILIGAGLDVTEEEDKIENISMLVDKKLLKEDMENMLSFHMLRDRDDVVFTPHSAFNTKEAIERIIKSTMKNIGDYA